MKTDLTGWLLDEARVFLQNDAKTAEYEIHIVETAPPIRPQRVESAKKLKSADEENKKPRPAVHYGEWRILRWRVLTTTEERSTLELLVAREQVLNPSL